ncbi:MAG TPA: M28 family peptidase [Bryobacteraceae bacterium]|nr:M28 family peptidase [Bryobacteraceae bacterium]
MCTILLLAQHAPAPAAPASDKSHGIDPQQQEALSRISAASLRGHLSFLASDLLEGRGTPSRGLDLAAEYIAAQFRRAGLEPVGDDGYYQTADMLDIQPQKSGFEMHVDGNGRSISISRDEITPRFRTALDLPHAELYKLDSDDERALKKLKPEDVAGRVVVTQMPDLSGGAATDALGRYRGLLRALEQSQPRLALLLTRDGIAELNTTLVTPESVVEPGPPRIVVRSRDVLRWYHSLKPGSTGATLDLRLPAPVETHVKLRNVIGLLRGSDSVLQDSYILLTAHYDHLGVRNEGREARIFNGANDDGSGTVTVVELASALAAMNPHPRRSIVFMTFYGEEEGTLGSLYYAHHPVFPLERTVADVNLEQMGRTDASDGRKMAQATFTGYEYSDLPRAFKAAGALTGVRVLSDAPYGDSFFSRSDNESLAKVGVPAHTLAVAFEFPDYHQPGDKWQKIDYDNMAKVDRMVALGLILLADNPQPPRWNEADSKTSRYVNAWREHHTTVSP